MTTWKIVADSGSCIRDIQSDEVSFAVVPLMINHDNKVYIDDENLDIASMLEVLSNSSQRSTTACPSPDSYAKHFTGADKIICFTITSGLSGSYNSAQLGAKMALQENPETEIYVCDSKSAGGEIDLLIRKSLEIINQNPDISLDDLVEQIETYHEKTHVDFLLQSVQNLVNNGRIKKIVGQMIGLLGIRLVGTRTPEGTIDLANKSRGQNRGFKTMIADMISRGYNGGRVEVSHGNNPSIGEAFIEVVLEKFPNAEIEHRPMSGLCTFYAEKNGLLVGFEIE